MKTMNDATTLAYELREFLACQVVRTRLRFVDSALFAGEPADAIMTGFALAYDLKLYVPQVIREKYLAEVNWNSDEREELQEYFAALPFDRAA
ncbi:hypothetical protein M2116_000653 [Aurantimicrobium minutum]|jgi:hypothetical protein|uniref:hypothetical protein n=1 Tax=Aurantimicrobium minutum TaxID=708131 RepID=UPI00240611AC|nr:hypothetical protein [Aurantimicrobium minutum]MDF9809709.1 hypothetical protein [Aurantimicrobium minutum]